MLTISSMDSFMMSSRAMCSFSVVPTAWRSPLMASSVRSWWLSRQRM